MVVTMDADSDSHLTWANAPWPAWFEEYFEKREGRPAPFHHAADWTSAVEDVQAEMGKTKGLAISKLQNNDFIQKKGKVFNKSEEQFVVKNHRWWSTRKAKLDKIKADAADARARAKAAAKAKPKAQPKRHLMKVMKHVMKKAMKTKCDKN